MAGRGGPGVAPDADFERFVQGVGRDLQRAAWLLCGDWAQAQDLAQTALMATWGHWAMLRDPAAAGGYTRRVLLNTYLRGARRRWTGEVPSASMLERATASPQDGSAAYEQVELRTALTVALALLPPRQRAAVVLRYFYDLTEQGSADVMGCSVGAIKSHTSKALGTLRRSPLLSDMLSEGVDQ